MFLDEPTTGLDPRSRNQVWEIVRALGRRGHDRAADHAVPRRGRPARRPDRGDRPRQGDRRGHAAASSRHRSAPARCTSGCRSRAAGRGRAGARRARSTRRSSLDADPAALSARVADPERVAPRRWPSCPAAGIDVADFSLGQPSLDEVFLALTGHPAEETAERGCRMRCARPRQHGVAAGHRATRCAVRSRPASARPGPGRCSASLTFGWRALLKIKHVPEQLFDVTMFPIMFTLMFTYLFGGALAGSTQEYLQFLLPGILVQAVRHDHHVHRHRAEHRHHEGRLRQVPVAAGLATVRRSSAPCSATACATRRGRRSSSCSAWSWGSGPRAAPSAWSLSVALAARVLVLPVVGLDDARPDPAHAERGDGRQHDGDVPARRSLSNIFVDPKTMPGWLQAVVEVNPITHLVTAVRGLMDGSVPAGEIGWVLVSSVLLVAVFGPSPWSSTARRRDPATASTWSTSTPTTRPTRPTPSPVPGPDTTRRAE